MAGHPTFRVDIVTPEATVWSGDAEFISARTTEGEIGIYAGHEPTMAALATGPVAIHTDDAIVSAGVHGGFLQIFQNSVTLLVDRAEITEGSPEDAFRVARELAAVEQTLEDV